MEDELEDKLLYHTYLSHLKLIPKISVSEPSSALAYIWKMVRLYFLRTESVVIFLTLVLLLMYLQSIDQWSRALLSRIGHAVSQSPLNAVQRLKMEPPDRDKQSWELRGKASAAYAIKGRRPHMEDRFIINEDINSTGVSLFAVFDGHGGEFAANYARDHLIQNLFNKIVELNGVEDKSAENKAKESNLEDKPKESEQSPEKKKSFRKSASTAEDSAAEVTDPELLARLARRGVTRTAGPVAPPPPRAPLRAPGAPPDYAELLRTEVLAADAGLLAAAKRRASLAGTTALLALLVRGRLLVANVGDSRGVMCDARGNAIPVSFDHKPQQVREQKRIEAAGGYIAFNGVWRVAGILATSRAMGDYPLKDKNLVIADPDILTFDLEDHKPQFVILASDGLWDTFTNEEAVKFIKTRLSESDYGAKSLTLQAYYRGSVDNITVMIINFTDGKYAIS